jgi:hypothetical protein
VTRPDLEKLLGGYAAGTLTPEERRALFDAAFADQDLFDALADEEALREVLADPACRERVRLALAEPPRTIFWWRRPAVWALAATAAAAVVLTVAVVRTKPTPVPQQIAMAKKPALPEFAASAPQQQQPATGISPRSVTEARPAARALAHSAGVPVNVPALAARDKELSATAAARSATLAARLRASEPAAEGIVAPSLAPPATVAANTPIAAPASLATRLRVSGPGVAGGIAAPPALAPQAPAVPPPPPYAASKRASAALNSDAAGTARNWDRSELQKAEIAQAQAAVEAKAEPAFGLRYTLLRGGEEVPPDTPFSRGESAGLRIEADRSGYLYVVAGKRALFAGPILANRPVLIETKPGILHLVLLPEPDSGPLSTLVGRTQRQFAGANQRVENLAVQTRGDQSVSIQNSSPPPQSGVLADVSINAR